MNEHPFHVQKLPFPWVEDIPNMSKEDVELYRAVITYEHRKLMAVFEGLDKRYAELVQLEEGDPYE